jgi:hypothetical protein
MQLSTIEASRIYWQYDWHGGRVAAYGTAQESKGVPRVGVLWDAGNAEEEAPYLRGLEQGLEDLGYFDGRGIVSTSSSLCASAILMRQQYGLKRRSSSAAAGS